MNLDQPRAQHDRLRLFLKQQTNHKTSHRAQENQSTAKNLCVEIFKFSFQECSQCVGLRKFEKLERDFLERRLRLRKNHGTLRKPEART